MNQIWSTVSHELRTPLNAILGWARMLGEGTLDQATHRRAVESITRNAHSMLAIIEDVLEMSRVGNGALRVARVRVEMGELVQIALDTVTPSADAKGLKVSWETGDEPVAVLGDPNLLSQVLANVLTNAINYTPAGGRVHVAVSRTDCDAQIRVADTGSGIDADLLPFIFERFRRGDSAPVSRYKGLGLGLAIARQLVELHGGSIRAESAGADKGTIIVITLPADHAEWTAERAVTRADAANSVLEESRIRIRGARVLVLDESEDARELTATVLSRYGADVRVSATAPDAKQMVENDQPDVVLASVGLGESEGYALIRWLRADPMHSRAGVPAGALTGYVRVEDRTRALVAGFQTLIRKPVEQAELVAAVAALAKIRMVSSEPHRDGRVSHG